MIGFVFICVAVGLCVVNGFDYRYPTWNTTYPNITINESAGLPPINSELYIIFNHSINNNNGSYNNGPIPIYWNGYFYVSWYNTLTAKESNDMRVLYSTSKDGIIWSEPIIGFNNLTHVGEENEPWLIINNHLYIASSVYDYPFEGLMRRIYGPNSNDKKGDIFWLTDIVPYGLERRCNLTFLDMDNETRNDIEQYIASLINIETIPGGTFDDVFFNERSLYVVPDTFNGTSQQLMLLLRTNDNRDDNRDFQWASTCINKLEYNIIKSDILFNGCRPGIGVLRWNMVNLLDNKVDNIHEQQYCKWTKPERTNIPNAPGRTCAAVLPNGSIYFIGNLVEKYRYVLVLATSQNGLDFTNAWAVRYNDINGSINSYEYPSSVLVNNRMYITYSINKNDIAINILNISHIQ